MQTNAMLYDLEIFRNEKKTKKAIFIDLETMDKVEAIINDEEHASLLHDKGKKGVLSIALVKKGYDYGVSFKSFKAA